MARGKRPDDGGARAAHSVGRSAAASSTAGSRADDEFVTVGRVGRPHGVRGAVLVRPSTDDPDARFTSGSVLETQSSEIGPLTVASARPYGGRLLVRFAGVADRTDAGRLRGVQLLIRAAARERICDPDEFYDSELIGLRAESIGGAELGVVEDVLHGPAGDYLVLIVSGSERLIPFVSAVVPEVDLAARTVRVDAPEGLLAL